MMSSMESASTLDARLGPNCSRYARCMPAPRKLSAYAAAIVGKLRNLAPYAVMELVLPGGSLMALLLWLYRRQKKVPVFPDSLDTLHITLRYVASRLAIANHRTRCALRESARILLLGKRESSAI
jgi:hypothetical protein